MHIQILALFLAVQAFSACQPDQDLSQPLAASIDLPSKKAALPLADVAPLAPAGILFRSADGGSSWEDLSGGLTAGTDIWGIFAGNGQVYLGSGKGLFRSSNAEAPVWEKIPLLNGPVNAVATGRTRLYASANGRGLFEQIPGLVGWNDISKTLAEKNIYTILENADGSLIVGGETGMYKSADGGKHWKQVFAGGLILDIVADKGTLMAGGWKGVQRSTDGGEHWENVLDKDILIKKTKALPGRFVAILGTEDTEKFIPEGVTNRLLSSVDNGKTWQRLEQAPLPIQNNASMDMRLWQTKDIFDIVQAGEYLFCSFDTGVYRSPDQGISWERVFYAKGKSTYSLVVSGNSIYIIAGNDGC
ncbi:MAG: hypothetical protein IT260_07785 [Saprospiraceae bacterium]|nr:hypothetical protein [Saprospiraceae bacterium]